MNTLIDKIDSKVITSVGGIVLALFLAFILYQIITNDLTHINETLKAQIHIQADTNQVLRENTQMIQSNTEILRILERRLNGK